LFYFSNGPTHLYFFYTGFTGKLITRYLSTHPQRTSFTFSLAARSRSKLDDLLTELSLTSSGSAAPDSATVGVLQVDVTNFDQLEAAVRTARVVINTVGPYWRWGTPVVRRVVTCYFSMWYCRSDSTSKSHRACIRHAVHYVDLSGETPWIREIVAECVSSYFSHPILSKLSMTTRFDYAATKTGTIVVPSCGMDSIPSDLSVYLSNQTLKSLNPPLDATTSTTAFKVRGGISGGTLASAISIFEELPIRTILAGSGDYSISPG
jgi:short subunit dehydrogenase-like uncharacterized protein